MKTNKNPLLAPASNQQEAIDQTAWSDFLYYSTPRSIRQDKEENMKKKKAALLTAMYSIMLFCILAIAAKRFPALVPYILAPFAVAGAVLFVKWVYRWISVDPVVQEDEEWQ